jgi:hypothetical protein
MKKHEDCSFSFEEWFKEVFVPFINTAKKQISELPVNYTYRPLPIGLSIEDSGIEGKGLFTHINIPTDTNLGISHTKFEDELIRRALGSFVNHSSEPNCKITDLGRLDKPHYYLVTLRDINSFEELTVDYYKSACGNEALFQLK